MRGLGWGLEGAGWGFFLALLLAAAVLVAGLNTYVLARVVFKGKHRLFPVGASFVLIYGLAVLGGQAPHLLEITIVATAHLIVLSRFKAWRIGGPPATRD